MIQVATTVFTCGARNTLIRTACTNGMTLTSHNHTILPLFIFINRWYANWSLVTTNDFANWNSNVIKIIFVSIWSISSGSSSMSWSYANDTISLSWPTETEMWCHVELSCYSLIANIIQRTNKCQMEIDN